jgi:hypothetical protein
MMIGGGFIEIPKRPLFHLAIIINHVNLTIR